MSDPTRLSDEQVAWWTDVDHPSDAARLAREVQEWRAFMLGGPCECASYTPSLSPMDAGDYPPCTNPACDGMGRVPGLIEKLDWLDNYLRNTFGYGWVHLPAIIAEARRMVEP